MNSMDTETRQRKARFFRLRVALSPVLVIAGAVILYCGYQGVVRLSVSGMIAGAAVILAGLCLRLTLAFCPFCGARINLRSGLLLWNYTCPHCHTSVAHGGGGLRTGPRTAASPAAFRRKVRLVLLGAAVGLLALAAAIPLGVSPRIAGDRSGAAGAVADRALDHALSRLRHLDRQASQCLCPSPLLLCPLRLFRRRSGAGGRPLSGLHLN